MRGQLDIFESRFAILFGLVLSADYDEKAILCATQVGFLAGRCSKIRRYTSRFLSIPVYPPRNVIPRHILFGIVNLARCYANGALLWAEQHCWIASGFGQFDAKTP